MKAWLRRLLGGAPEPGEWALGTGNEDGHPVVVRTRTRPPQGMTGDGYPVTVEMVWRFDGGAQDGMPPSELSALMAECEDVLHSLEGPANGMLGITITGNNRREWIWYVADAEAFAARVRALLAAAGGRFPLELSVAVRPARGGREMVAHDFSTPEGALLKLEDAYRAKDIEGAVACKDFRREAEMMLGRMGSSLATNGDFVGETAKVLELAFRKQIQDGGFPSLDGLECTFPTKETRPDGTVVVTEVCRFPDGGTSEQRVQTWHTPAGWRVLTPLE